MWDNIFGNMWTHVLWRREVYNFWYAASLENYLNPLIVGINIMTHCLFVHYKNKMIISDDRLIIMIIVTVLDIWRVLWILTVEKTEIYQDLTN